MNYVRSNSLSLKYQGFPPSDSQDIGIRKFECVAKTPFLSLHEDTEANFSSSLLLRKGCLKIKGIIVN